MWGLLLVLAGALYGWMTPGHGETGRLLWTGLLFGLVLAFAAVLLGAAVGFEPLPFGTGLLGTVASIAVLTLLVVFGAWIGDRLSVAAAKGRAA